MRERSPDADDVVDGCVEGIADHAEQSDYTFNEILEKLRTRLEDVELGVRKQENRQLNEAQEQ